MSAVQFEASVVPVAASSPAVAFRTLLTKEMLRFWKVSFQTIAAPVLTAVLYLLVFGQVLADHVEVNGATLKNGLLHIDLTRNIPEALKPRRIEISAASAKAKQIEAKAA